MRTITTSILRSALSEGRSFALIDVLPEQDHALAHIPGAINIPAATSDFTDRVSRRLPNKGIPVVLYCSSGECDASTRAAVKLERAGFRAVYDYQAGLDAWREAGNPVSPRQRPSQR